MIFETMDILKNAQFLSEEGATEVRDKLSNLRKIFYVPSDKPVVIEDNIVDRLELLSARFPWIRLKDRRTE
jgi:hypothetical protein